MSNLQEKRLMMSQGEGAGRPTKFTPDRIAKILGFIKKGVPYELSAQASGIHESTLYAWLSEGNKDILEGNVTELAKFSEDIKNIEAHKISSLLEDLEQKPDRWQANAWLLERHPRSRKQFSANGDALEKLADQIATLEAKLEAKDNG